MKRLSLLIIVVSFFCTASTHAATELETTVEKLNFERSLGDMVKATKAMFPTEKDHKIIDQQSAALAKLSTKWNWRFEADGESVAFRLNGPVAFNIKPIDPLYYKVEVNGKPYTFKPGTSYTDYVNQMHKLLNPSVAHLDFFLFESAHAVAPAVAAVYFASVFTIAGLAQNPPVARTCNYQNLDLSRINATSDYAGAFYDSNAIGTLGFKSGKVCRRSDGRMPNVPGQRIGMLAKNFLPSGKFYAEAARTNAGRAQLDSAMFSNCIFQTQQYCADQVGSVRWNMTPFMAHESCKLAWTAYKSCEFPTVIAAPAVRTAVVAPAAKQKPGPVKAQPAPKARQAAPAPAAAPAAEPAAAIVPDVTAQNDKPTSRSYNSVDQTCMTDINGNHICPPAEMSETDLDFE